MDGQRRSPMPSKTISRCAALSRLACSSHRACRAKQRALRAMGRDEATTQTSGLSPAALIGWFWRQAFPGQMQAMSAEALAHELWAF